VGRPGPLTGGAGGQIHVILRDATIHDSGLLLEWRNDPLAVHFSVSQRTVGRDEHERWFAARVEDASTRLWVAEEGGEAVGQLRVDTRDGVGTVSIGVAPGYRGRGLGTAALTALVAEVGSDPTIETLRALVHPENVASLVAFERAGFRRLDEPHQGFVVLEWPVTTTT
jgi:UDP-2,4-diacetamido-2,4,6-trideoxy-beta-L-altropyranose hydrolase